jgi:Lysylphosphatidylglycerol synthase TM region
MPQVVALGITGMCFAAAVACSAASWRAMLGTQLTLGDACARYGVGSLANTFLPGRAGDALRISLFGRVTPGGMLSVAGGVAGVGAVRWLALLPLGIAGILGSGLPPLALVGAAAALVPLPAVWLLARCGSKRARVALAPLRVARRSTYAAVVGWVAGTLAARIVAAATAGSALGISHPLATALLVVPALEVAGVVPLTPANIGVAGGAAAIAFHAHGTPMHTALAAGFVLHAVETCAGVAFGAASTVLLARTTPWRQLIALRPPVAGLTQH